MPYKNREDRLARQQERYKQRRNKWLRDNGPCQKCGSWNQLEIDHIDPSTKKLDVGKLWGLSENNSVLQTELKKCQVLCSDCHKTKTFNNPPPHGSPSRYSNQKCRCGECTNAWRIYCAARKPKC